MTKTESPMTSNYFGYGSNLWFQQMEIRCPQATYLGVARLSGYRWIINERGYANVVQISGDYDDTIRNSVFGLVWSLSDTDEDRLDKNEGVPHAYTKEYIDVDFWESEGDKPVDVTDPQNARKLKTLVYIDRKRTSAHDPKEEYIYRMNKGIEDAIHQGVPEKYVREVIREFIPTNAAFGVKEMAEQQAVHFTDQT